MKVFFIVTTEAGDIFSEELEFATELDAATWAKAQEADERLFVEKVIEVI